MSLPTQKNVFQSINDHALLKSVNISEVISALTDFFFYFPEMYQQAHIFIWITAWVYSKSIIIMFMD